MLGEFSEGRHSFPMCGIAAVVIVILLLIALGLVF
jgi:hypothetical protein